MQGRLGHRRDGGEDAEGLAAGRRLECVAVAMGLGTQCGPGYCCPRRMKQKA